MKKKWELSRRAFIQGAGYAAALPLLEAMLPGVNRAQAAGVTTPPRLFLGYMPHGYGVNIDDFFPKVSSGSTNYLSGVVPKQLASLVPHQDRVWVLKNLNYDCGYDGGHPTASAAFTTQILVKALTKDSKGMPVNLPIKTATSLDQRLYNYFKGDLRYKPLCISCADVDGPNGNDTYTVETSSLSWINESLRADKTTTPLQLYNRLIGIVGTTTAPSGTSETETQKFKRGVMHYLNDDYNRIVKRSGLGKVDRLKMDEYFTSLSEIQRQIDFKPVITNVCAVPTTGQTYNQGGIKQGEDPTAKIKLMIDLSIMAMQCDVNRIVSFMLDRENSYRLFSFLNDGEAVIKGNYHPLTHAGVANEAPGLDDGKTNPADKPGIVTRIKRWELSFFAYYLQQMKAKTDASGASLLDGTLSIFGGGLGNANLHDHYSVPTLLVPQKSAYAGSGKFVDFGSKNASQLWSWVASQYGDANAKNPDGTPLYNAANVLKLPF